MKLQVKKTKVEMEEKEIKLPYFFKRKYSHIKPDYYAIFSDDKAMAVFSMGSLTCCDAASVSDKIGEEDIYECSESEFTEAFETTMERIQSMMPVTQ